MSLDLAQQSTMIKCRINRLYLGLILLFLFPYILLVGDVVMSRMTNRAGLITALTLSFLFPIYFALFQVKTIEIKDGQITFFYPFRLWTRTFPLDKLETWKFRRNTKAIRFQTYIKTSWLTLKFTDSIWLTFVSSISIKDFDKLHEYLNEKYKERRANKMLW